MTEIHPGGNPWSEVVFEALPSSISIIGTGQLSDIELPTVAGIVPAGTLAVAFYSVAPPVAVDLGQVDVADAPEPPVARDQSTVRVGERLEPVPAPVEPAIPTPVADTEIGTKSTYHQLLNLSTTDLQEFLSERRSEEDALASEEQGIADDAGHEADVSAGNQVAPVSNVTSTWPDPDQEAVSDRSHESAAEAPEARPTTGLVDGVPWASGSSFNAAPLTREQPLTQSSPSPAVAPAPNVPSAPATPLHDPNPVPDAEPQTASLEPEQIAAVTTSRAALLRQLAESAPSGPTVLALHCTNGHPSPPSSDACRVCQAPLPTGQDPVRIARPNLGILRFSNELIVPLDRSVIFGRDPRPSTDNPAERPNLIRPIESGELSRMHASITIEGWQLLLRDLGSTHGTFLTRPGATTEQIRAQKDYQVEPGSVVSFAEIVSFTYEATA
jgi:hypothetical protein